MRDWEIFNRERERMELPRVDYRTFMATWKKKEKSGCCGMM